jgi:hypothetical protein
MGNKSLLAKSLHGVQCLKALTTVPGDDKNLLAHE